MSHYIPSVLHRPGALVEGRYRLRGLVSRGRLSVVYRGHDERFRKDVAVKIVPGLAAPVDANRVGRVRHPSVIEVLDVAPVGPEHTAIVMEWVDGTQLGTLLKSGALPLEQGLAVFEQLAEALVSAHGQRVIHGTLQPSNVVITVDEAGYSRARLAGLDRLIVSTTATQLTEPPEGAPNYAAPELRDLASAEPPVDIYALGATMWHALTGQPQLVVERPGRATVRVPNRVQLPSRVAAILERCVRPDAGSRYPTAQALLDDLRALRQPILRPVWVTPWFRTVATAVVLLLGLAMLAYLWLLLSSAGIWDPDPSVADLQGGPPLQAIPADAPPRVRASPAHTTGAVREAGSDAAVFDGGDPGSASAGGPAESAGPGGSGNAGEAPRAGPAQGRRMPATGEPVPRAARPTPPAITQPGPPATATKPSPVEPRPAVVAPSSVASAEVSASTSSRAVESPTESTGEPLPDPGSSSPGADETEFNPSIPAGLGGASSWVGQLGGRPTEWSLRIAADGGVTGVSRTRFGADWVARRIQGRAVPGPDGVTLDLVESGGVKGSRLVGIIDERGGAGSLAVRGRDRASWTVRRR